MTPGRSNLPISTATISNLRRVLQYNFYTDLVTLWDDRVYDLTAMQKDATEVYGVSDQTIWRHGRKRGVVRVQASWSEEDKEQLRRFVAAGFSAREIAREMGRSPYAAAYMRRALLGMISTARRPWTEAEKEELLRLRSKGMGIRTIAERLGRTEYAVGYICHEIGVFSPKRNRTWSEEEKTRLMLLIQAGHDEQYMSETLGRTRAAIHQMRQRLQRKKRSR
jgi:transposase-like protein